MAEAIKMPIYEYKCSKCRKRFDKLQSIHSDPLKKCIYCGGAVEKMVSSTAFQFKGNGWYITDYKNRPKKESPTPKKEPAKTASK